MEKKPLRHILVGGFWFSGSSAVTDFISEFRNVFVPDPEISFITFPDGIIDLGHKLTSDWSPSRADYAIKRFYRMARYLSRDSIKYIRPGGKLHKNLTGRFMEFTREYLESLYLSSFRGRWGTCLSDLTPLKYTSYRLRRKARVNPGFKIHLTEPLKEEEFINITRKYLDKIFLDSLENSSERKAEDIDIIGADFGSLWIPADPLLKYFENPLVVIVERDPRDIFVKISGKRDSKISASQYCCMHRALRRGIEELGGRENVEIIKFEELVEDYDRVSESLMRTLGLSVSDHTEKGRYFNPGESRKNIGTWKNYKNIKDIELIEKELL